MLRYYIGNREKVLQVVCRIAKCTRGDAKELMLILTYGGSVKTWKRGVVELPVFIGRYTSELRVIATLVHEKYTDYPIVTKDNPMFSRTSVLMQDMEHETLMVLARTLRAQGYTPGVYMFDGIMVYRKERDSTTPIEPATLELCENAIHTQLGYSVKLEEKEI